MFSTAADPTPSGAIGGDPLSDVLVLLAPVVLGGLLVAWQRYRARRGAAAWAATRDLELTPTNRDLVTRYLVRTRTARTVGGAVGVLVNAAPGALYNLTDNPWWYDNGVQALRGFGWALVFVGYLLGAFLAEVTLPRPVEAGRAVVSTRDVAGYVAPFTRPVLRAAVPLSVVLAVVAVVVVEEVPGSAYGAAVLVLLGVPLVEALQRYVVRRRQAMTEPDLVAADDAIRAATVQAATGAGLGLVMTSIGGQLGNLAVPLDGLVGLVCGVGGVLLVLLALPVWLGYGTDHVWAPPVRIRGDEVSA